MDSWLHIPVASQHSFNKTQTLSVSHKALLALSLPASLNPSTLPLDRAPQPDWHSLHFRAHSFHSSGHFHWLFPLSATLCLQSTWEQLILITQGSPQMSLLQRSHPGIQAISRLETTFSVPLYSHSPICFHRPCGSLKSIHLFTCLSFLLFIVIIYLFIVSISGTLYLMLWVASPPLNGMWSPVQ